MTTIKIANLRHLGVTEKSAHFRAEITWGDSKVNRRWGLGDRPGLGGARFASFYCTAVI